MRPFAALSVMGLSVRALTSPQPGRLALSSLRTRSTARPALSMNFFSALQSLSAKKEIDYTKLAGLPMSFGAEAAEYALQGVIPTKSKNGYAVATFAGGCFWGIELAFQRQPGVVATCVGYVQGKTEKPTYEEVCGGATGHTEAIQIIYDENEVDYAQLCDLFWQRLGNDATRFHQVGNDYGSQYRHGIYCHTSEQLQVAQQSLAERQGQFRSQIMTEVEAVQVFWPAEEYHQQYLQKGGRFGMPQSAEKGATETIRCYG